MILEIGKKVKVTKDVDVVGGKLYKNDIHIINNLVKCNDGILVELELDSLDTTRGFVWTLAENLEIII